VKTKRSPRNAKRDVVSQLLPAAESFRTPSEIDVAILQRLREELWESLRQDFCEKTVRTLLPLILAARRQELAERRAAHGTTPEAEKQQEVALQELFGRKPAVEPAQTTSGEPQP
jgi:hypothetical protein